MDTSHASDGPDTGSSTKPSRDPARRSSRIKEAEKAPDSGADTSPQPKNAPKRRRAYIMKLPKARIPRKPKTPKDGTKKPKLESSPIQQDHTSIPEQAKTTERNRLVVEPAITSGVKPSIMSRASTIKPDDSVSDPSLSSCRPAAFGISHNPLEDPRMTLTYNSQYGHGQVAEHFLANQGHQDRQEVSTERQRRTQKFPIPSFQAQPLVTQPSHAHGSSNFSPAKRRTPSAGEHVAARRLASGTSHEHNRAMINPHEYVSLSNIQSTRGPSPPLPNRSRSAATPGTFVASALGNGGIVSGIARRADISKTTADISRNTLEQRPPIHGHLAGRMASRDSFVPITPRIGSNAVREISNFSVPEPKTNTGRDLRGQNGLLLDTLASHSGLTYSRVGLTTASGLAIRRLSPSRT